MKKNKIAQIRALLLLSKYFQAYKYEKRLKDKNTIGNSLLAKVGDFKR